MALEYVASLALVAFLFGLGVKATSFLLGLSTALPFLLGELEGSSLRLFSPNTTHFCLGGPYNRTLTFGFFHLLAKLLEMEIQTWKFKRLE